MSAGVNSDHWVTPKPKARNHSHCRTGWPVKPKPGPFDSLPWHRATEQKEIGLLELNAQIEARQADPDADRAEIKRLQAKAAELIGARVDASFGPIERAGKEAVERARRLLGE